MSWVASLLLLGGAVFMFLGAVGLVRFPDLFTRMQAATKTATVGAGLVLLGVGIRAATVEVVAQAIFIGLLLFATLPIAAHVIARAAHRTGVMPWGRPPGDPPPAARSRRPPRQTPVPSAQARAPGPPDGPRPEAPS